MQVSSEAAPAKLPYLARVVNELQQHHEKYDTDERSLLLDNVWDDLSSEIIYLAAHKESSRYLVRLLFFAWLLLSNLRRKR